MTRIFMGKPWNADVLEIEKGRLYISSGKSQGIKVGMKFNVELKGRQVKSKATGTTITLPSDKIAEIEIVSLFGDDILNQGSVAKVINGSVNNYKPSEMIVTEYK